MENTYTEVTLDGYEAVNLYGEYQPVGVDGLSVRLDLYNLFDTTCASRSSDGVDFAGAVPLTEPGRTVALTASFAF
ncbi:hypothetical protein [Loktanella salsilacus]|uniref:hypothetical protein n=1 Tax=Loktanella salsilacus TaxID=195913 RepID=UPI0037353BF9